MLEHLFGSKTRVKLLRLFFRHPEKSFYVREITRMLETQINAVRREIESLEKSGVLLALEKAENPPEAGSSASSALRKYYRVNPQGVFYLELSSLLSKETLANEQEFINDLKKENPGIVLFLLSGYFTGDKRAPTDILLVGKIHENKVEKAIREFEKNFGNELRYTFMTAQEFHDRRHIMDKFLFDLFETNHHKVVNTLGV